MPVRPSRSHRLGWNVPVTTPRLAGSRFERSVRDVRDRQGYGRAFLEGRSPLPVMIAGVLPFLRASTIPRQGRSVRTATATVDATRSEPCFGDLPAGPEGSAGQRRTLSARRSASARPSQLLPRPTACCSRASAGSIQASRRVAPSSPARCADEPGHSACCYDAIGNQPGRWTGQGIQVLDVGPQLPGQTVSRFRGDPVGRGVARSVREVIGIGANIATPGLDVSPLGPVLACAD
jgi:hypothetical protein